MCFDFDVSIFFRSFTECESLVRKMLVRDPARRCSLTTVRKHPWMRVEVPPDMLELDNSNPIQNINCTVENEGLDNIGPTGHLEQQLPSKGQQPLNEQVLRVMQSLGIDPTRTTEVRWIKYRIDHRSTNY